MTPAGVIVTLLADNYFGYCKKEVKTQIGYSANLFGLAEEEHAGGALAFPRRNHGEEYGVDSRTHMPGYSFEDMVERYGEIMDVQPEGYGIDKNYPDIIYVPQKVRMDLNAQTITWVREGETRKIRLQPGKIYMQPNGYKVEMEKHPGAPSWRLVGMDPEGTFCHKPSTVSGGGKSEISKSLNDAVIYRSLFVDDLQKDLAQVEEIFDRDYSKRFKPGIREAGPRSHPQTLEYGTQSGLGDQAADADLQLHRRIQCLAGFDFPAHPCAGVPDQALLPSGVGRRLAETPVGGRGRRRPGA